MVGMFVGDEDRINVLHLQACFFNAVHQLLYTEPAVYEQSEGFGSGSLYQGCVARASAAKAFEPDHSGPSLKRKPLQPVQRGGLLEVVSNDLHNPLGIG